MKNLVGTVIFASLCACWCFSSCSSKQEEYDVVIIGSGGAGLCAALSAKRAGASVIVFEKMAFAGGNTNYATGGLNASETQAQKAMGIKDSNSRFFEDTMKGGKNLNNPALVNVLTEKSSETVDWLTGFGMDLSDVGKLGGATNSRAHRPSGGGAVGNHFVKVMTKACKDAGIELRFNSEVTDIIKKDGRASGVRVLTDGKSIDVAAKAVVAATGGFAANPDIIVSYKPELKGFGTTNHPGAKGDAIKLVEPFNAALVDMEQIQTHPTVVPVKNIMITEAVRGNGAIMINREGKRFEQELATRDVMSSAILAQKGNTAYLLFDTGIRNSLKAIESYAKAGLLTEGGSLGELAEKLGIPAADLEDTVKRYNRFVDEKKDSDFGRADMPCKLETPPFYAVEAAPSVHHTMGGIAINEKAEVLTAEGTVVLGLFAAGEVTGGIHGANRLGGNAVTDIAVFGKIAGENAAAYAKTAR